MPHYRKLPTEEEEIRYKMHQDGFINQLKGMVTNMVDSVQKILPKGAGVSMGAGATVLAVGAGLALSEVILVWLAGYCIGKTVANWVTSSAREVVNESFNSIEE